MPPGSARASSRAAMLTPSPKMSPSLDDDVAEMDADAELDPRSRPAALRRPCGLDLDGAAHGLHRAPELGQQAVAGAS